VQVGDRVDDINSGYLTEEDLIKAHGLCNKMLHARSPYKQGENIQEFMDKFTLWIEKVHYLLNYHMIKRPGPHPELWVGMNDVATGLVFYNLMARVGPLPEKHS
jgi:hypothetical protein